jgi:hypothetical protein
VRVEEMEFDANWTTRSRWTSFVAAAMAMATASLWMYWYWYW